jgi:hypothetical protein
MLKLAGDHPCVNKAEHIWKSNTHHADGRRASDASLSYDIKFSRVQTIVFSVSKDLICVYIQKWPAWLSQWAHAHNQASFQLLTIETFNIDGKVDGKSETHVFHAATRDDDDERSLNRSRLCE